VQDAAYTLRLSRSAIGPAERSAGVRRASSLR